MATPPLRILLIEDNPGDARLLHEALREIGHRPFEIAHATRLEDGLLRLQREQIDVVLLDLSLPDANGLETVRRTQASAPDVPLVILTGLQDDEFAVRAVREGAEDYLVKGQMDGDLLFRSMRYAIERHRLRIEQQHAEEALRRAGEELETRVRQRTEDLQRANDALRTEARERKQVEIDLATARDAALDSARLKAEFLANMSHEIRTPMNGVIGMTRLMLKTRLTQEQQSYAETIRDSAAALLKLLNDILDLSKIEAGKLNFDLVDFNVVETVEGAMELLAEGAHAKGLDLASRIEAGVPAQLRGDPFRLRQVLTNLLSNAIKFTEHGQVVASVGRVAEREGQLVLRFEVRDTGIGIPAAAQSALFQAFSQGDGSTTRRFGGTGLGLAISKQLVQRMGGEIGFESAVNSGTVFWFTLALGRGAVSPAALAPTPRLAGARILVADSNAATREILCGKLIEWGSRCSTAADAKAAHDALREAAAAGAPMQLALLDVDLPGQDGIALAATIKADRHLAATRLILLAPLIHRVDSERLLGAGLDALLRKPVRQSRLGDVVRSLLGGEPVNQSTRIEAPRQATVQPRLGQAPLRILLAEDNRVNQQVALGQLRSLGCTADVVANGLEVLEALRNRVYDVILLDCQMPLLDGYETARRIRQDQAKQPTARAPRIIAMTAHAMQGDRERCLAAGMDDYLAKPVEESDLARALARAHDPSREPAAWPLADLSAASDPAVFENPPPRKSAPPTVPSAESPPVDLARLIRITNGDETQLRELIELYLTQTEALLSSLRTAIQSGSAAEVEILAHSSQGNSSACGMHGMVPIMRGLLAQARLGCWSAAEELRLDGGRQLERIRRFVADSRPAGQHPAQVSQ